MDKKFKKGDTVKWKIGRAQKYSKGTVDRVLKTGTKVPKVKGFKSSVYEPGMEIERDSAIVRTEFGARIIGLGYLKAA